MPNFWDGEGSIEMAYGTFFVFFDLRSLIVQEKECSCGLKCLCKLIFQNYTSGYISYYITKYKEYLYACFL